MQPPFDSSERKGQEVGDTRGRPFFVIEQAQDDLNIRGQVGKQGANSRFTLRFQYLFQRLARCRFRLPIQQGFKIVLFCRGLPLVAYSDPAGMIARDGIQPARELARFLQLRQGAKGQQKRLLRHIMRRLAAVQNLHGNEDSGIAKPRDQFVTRFQAAHLRQANHFRIAEIL